ncbi:DMT family transporter [Desulfotomaculum varum]
MKPSLKGFLFLVGATFLWGVSGTVAKILFNQQVNPMHLVTIRLTLSFAVLLLYLSFRQPHLLKVKKSQLPYLAVLGTAGVGLVQFSYLFTISQTNVATAVFLQYLAPALVAVYAFLRQGESKSPVKLLALLLTAGGGYLIVNGAPGGGLAVNWPGLVSGLVSAASLAFYTLYGKKGLSTMNHWTMLLYCFGFGALVWNIFQPPWVAMVGHSLTEWYFFLYIAVFATVLPFGFYFCGLNYLTPVITSLTSTMEPVVAAVVAFLALGETLYPLQLVGCSMILIGVIAIQCVPEQEKLPDKHSVGREG